MLFCLQPLGGSGSIGSIWSYTVYNGSAYLNFHFDFSLVSLCHDSCAPYRCVYPSVKCVDM